MTSIVAKLAAEGRGKFNTPTYGFDGTDDYKLLEMLETIEQSIDESEMEQ